MKCWIDGSVCLSQRGNNFGLFSVSGIFCRGCPVLVSNLRYILETLEEMGIEVFQLSDQPVIDEDDQYEISEHAGIILTSLGLLKKEIDKKSKKREISLKQIAILLDDIPRLRMLFKVLRKKR